MTAVPFCAWCKVTGHLPTPECVAAFQPASRVAQVVSEDDAREVTAFVRETLAQFRSMGGGDAVQFATMCVLADRVRREAPATVDHRTPFHVRVAQRAAASGKGSAASASNGAIEQELRRFASEEIRSDRCSGGADV